MNSVEISIITVNFSSGKKIARLKKSLQNTTQNMTWEWIIVDNFSSETESKKIKKIGQDDQRIHTILLNKNLGYGEGNAEGVRFAQGKFLIILNPDTEITDHIFETLVTVLKKESKPTICVPILQTKDGEILENTRKFPHIFPLIIRRMKQKKTPKNYKKITKVDWAQGSFWALEKKVFEQLNGFDKRFFLFFEDTDFCQRLKKIGGQVLVVPKAVAYHDPNRLSGGNIFKAMLRKTFWIHIHSAVKYFNKWK